LSKDGTKYVKIWLITKTRCKDENEMKKTFQRLENKYMNRNTPEGIREDQVSHFILRIKFLIHLFLK
jgi:hypothetical protein